jgi:lipopolysaccharide/colanic/teichoic acid biosynthesis glycosyltransferase
MESSEEKLAYDLYYVKNASLFLDLEIMLSTLRSLTKGSR